MSAEGSVRKILLNSGIYFTASVITKSVTFLLLPVYTRFLTPGDYGILALAQAFQQVVVSFIGLGLLDATSRLFFRYHHDPPRLQQYLSTILATIVGAAIVTALLVTGIRASLSQIVFNEAGLDVYILAAIWYVPFTQIVEFALVVLVDKEKPLSYVRVNSGRLAGIIVFTLLFVVVLRRGALGSLEAVLASTAIFAGVALWVLRRDLQRSFNRAYLSESLRFGLPLLPHIMSGWVIAYIDRIYLSRYQNLSTVGIYQVGFTISTIMTFSVASVMQAWNPVFFKALEREGRSAHGQLTKGITLIVVGMTTLGLALAIFSREIVSVLTAPAFHSAYVIVPLLIAYNVIGCLNQLVVGRLFFASVTGWLSLTTFIAMGVVIVSNIVFVPTFGASGAAAATALSGLTSLILNSIIGARKYPFRYEYGQLVRAIGWALIAFAVAWGLPDWGLLINFAAKVLLMVVFAGGLFILRVFNQAELALMRTVITKLIRRLRVFRNVA